MHILRRLSHACLVAAAVVPPLVAQSAPPPSRKELLERDGIVWGSPAVWNGPFEENLSDDLKLAGLSRLWLEVKLNFPNFAKVPDLDWDKAFLDFIPRVRASSSTYEYYRVLQQMCALLKDGHSNVFLPPELANRMEVNIPLRLDVIEGRVFVSRVESSTLAASGISPGMEILSIDGVAVQDYARVNRQPFATSNSPQSRELMLYSYGLLSGPRDKDVTVQFRDKNGTLSSRQIQRRAYDDQSSLPAFEMRQLSGNIVYVAINSFASELVQKEFEKNLPIIRAADGLILDVRENDGGSGALAYNILGYLTSTAFATPAFKSRQYVAIRRVWGTAGAWFVSDSSKWEAKPQEYFSKPVVLLTGPRSLSATDVFADGFQLLHRGRIVGEATGGSTGDPLGYALPGGGFGRVATSTDTGSGVVGRGVLPDVEVKRRVADFLEGRDAALDAGVAELRKSMAHR